MQTFLPYSDFGICARILDDKRLYKQIVECKQILNTLKGKSNGWKNHPAILMWKGYEELLRYYQLCMLDEWCNRRWDVSIEMDRTPALAKPEWLGDKELHLSHQSNLVRKNPEHYRKYFPNVPDNLGYKWPTNK